MKGQLILLDEIDGREAAARLVDGKLDDLLVEGPGLAPGTILRVRAGRAAKGLGGMFCEGPEGNVFLRQVKGLSPGETLLVQVSGHAEPGKAPPVTAKLLFKSRYAIVTPGAPGLNLSRRIRDEALRDALQELAHEAMAGQGADLGLILRSSCAEAEPEEIAEDIAAMCELAQRVLADAEGAPEVLVAGDGPHEAAWRDWTGPAQVERGPGAFAAHGLEEEIAALRAPLVPLPGGAHMAVEATRAMVAVDINSGGDLSGAAGLKANIAAMRALPRALRLRGLGGQIVVDMAPMPRKERRQVESALRGALKADGIETALVGWTGLGHLELLRHRARLPLAECLA